MRLTTILTTPAQLWVATVLIASPASAQSATRPPASPTLLREFSASVEELAGRVSPSVVQIVVTGYGPVDERSRGETGMVIGRQRSIGSGAIIDADGYIITNAHVVAGARHVQVILHRDTTADGPVRSLAEDASHAVDARIVGTANDIDLALLKVDVTGLRPIPLADYDAIRQGELVFAFGSPEGLRNSVTMGVVSAVARQPDPDQATIYIQTDAPINPGNSGGPLVNVDGELVGLNTLILSESGGSQGLGFAIPSAIVASAFPQLQKYGHLHRGLLGFSMQAVTPTLAAALELPRTTGVMVSDVMPDGPAETAGLGVKDLIATVNGKHVDSVPMLSLELNRSVAGDTVVLGVMRGTKTESAIAPITIKVAERPHPIDRLADLSDPEKSAVAQLGIIGIDINDDTAGLLPSLRIPSGVLVAARTQGSSSDNVPLVAGDVIHSVNALPVKSLDGLRVLVGHGAGSRDLVLQIERNNQLLFVTCQIY
jgi:serine protease Do